MVKSLDRALSILEYMSRRRYVSVTELANEFELDKASVSRMMQTFKKHGMAIKNETNSKYRIGSGTLLLSYNVMAGNRVARVARPALEELANELDTTARLCMIEGKKVYIIDQVHGAKGKTGKDADIPGISKPLYCSAIGKIIMAYMKEKNLNALLDELEYTQYTENTITNKEDLLQELKIIRANGYAVNAAEFSDRAYCIAVPVFWGNGRSPQYCIGITGWTDHRQSEEVFDRTVRCMQEISKAIMNNYVMMKNASFE